MNLLENLKMEKNAQPPASEALHSLKVLATLRFTTRAEQRGRLQEEILESFL